MNQRNWKKRRTNQIIRRVAATFVFTLMLCIIMVQNTKIAKSDVLDTNTNKVKVFHLHEIQYKETLEDIAEKYCDYSEYETSADYIKEIRSINQEMNSGYNPGDQIIVPIYVIEK